MPFDPTRGLPRVLFSVWDIDRGMNIPYRKMRRPATVLEAPRGPNPEQERASMPRADSANTTVAPAVMTRAWAIFRETYDYPRMPFRSLGRRCFVWALRAAWAEA